jgi:hypothetical protein
MLLPPRLNAGMRNYFLKLTGVFYPLDVDGAPVRSFPAPKQKMDAYSGCLSGFSAAA